MLVVLVLMSVMLLGGLAMARMTEVGSIAIGNAGYREAAIQASEVGLNAVFQQVRNIPIDNENDNAGDWYWSVERPMDDNGLPVVAWDSAPEIKVGTADAYSVRYIAERVCTIAAVSEPLRECLVKHKPELTSATLPDEKVDPPNAKQFRVTVRVVGPKDTTIFVQSLITKG